jgi:HK97 family phage prohead protease
MRDILEFKDYNGGVKDVDMKSKRVTGYLSAFNNKDFDNDIIVKGAFTKSILERKNDIYFLNQHKWNQPHGKFSVLLEDEKGLYFESEPLIDTTYSQDTLKLYEAGILKEHSIGFNTIKSDMDSKTGIRMIKEVKLYEGSNVTLGANNQTPFTGFKGLTLIEVNDQHKKILKAFRSGTFTDETFVLLEIALKELQLQAYELGKNTQKEVKEPIIITPELDEPLDTIKSFINSLKK